LPNEILLDVSMMEAPRPLQEALSAVSKLKDGEYILMVHRMRPCHLFSFLERMMVWSEDFEVSSDKYVVFMANSDDLSTIEYIKGKIADEYGRTLSGSGSAVLECS